MSVTTAIRHSAMRFSLLLLLLLRIEGTEAWLENCPCSSIPKSTSCPFNRECDSSRVVDANCTLTCADGFQLMYRTGLPWRSTSLLHCSDGRHQPSTGSALGASVAAVACAAQSKCTNCLPPSIDSYCHPDYVCRKEAVKMTQTDDGCAITSCTWGELITIDTVPGERHSVPHIASIPIQQPTVPHLVAVASTPVDMTSTKTSNRELPSKPALGSAISTAFPESVIPNNGANLTAGLGIMNISSVDPPPAATNQGVIGSTLTGAATSTTLVQPELSPIATVDMSQRLSGSQISGAESKPGTMEIVPKGEEEYYDDSMLATDRLTMHGGVSTQPTTTSTSTMTSAAPPTSTTASTADTQKLDLFGRPISNKNKANGDFNDPISSRMNFKGLKKTPKDDDYDYEEFSASPSSFLARMRRGAFSFINRQTRRLERNIFGFSEEATAQFITVDQKSGADKLINRVIGKYSAISSLFEYFLCIILIIRSANEIGAGAAPTFFQLPWDDFAAEDERIKSIATTTKKPDRGRIMGKAEAPQKTRNASDWLKELFEKPKTTTIMENQQRQEVNEIQFGGEIGANWMENNQMLIRDNVRHPTLFTRGTTTAASTSLRTTREATIAAVAMTSTTTTAPTTESTPGVITTAAEMVAVTTTKTTVPFSTTIPARIGAAPTDGDATTSAAPMTLTPSSVMTAAKASATQVTPDTVIITNTTLKKDDSRTSLAQAVDLLASSNATFGPPKDVISSTASTPLPGAKSPLLAADLLTTEATTTARRVVEEAPHISPPDESPIEEIGQMAMTRGPVIKGDAVPAVTKAQVADTPFVAPANVAPIGPEVAATSGRMIVEPAKLASPSLESTKELTKSEIGKEALIEKSLPVSDEQAVAPGGIKAAKNAHTVDFDSTSPRQLLGKPSSNIIEDQQLSETAGASTAAPPRPMTSLQTSLAPHPSETWSRAGSLKCSGNGLWYDCNFALHQSCRVTCARKKSCGTCTAPPLLQQCDERHECGSSKIISIESENGCVKGVCEDGESFIAVRDLSTERSVADIAEMSCDPFGRWRSSMFEVIGENIEAVCYRPKCKKCMLRELSCSADRHCDMSLLAEPEPNHRCYSLRCGEGSRMLVRDDSGAIRTATKIDCSHSASWVLTEEGTGQEIAVTGSEAALTCEYNPPPCQLCPLINSSVECPGASHRPCFPLSQKGGVSEKSCRINTCEPGDELWIKMETGWVHPDKLSMLGCAGEGWIGNDGVTKLPLNAEAVCKRAPCDNCIIPTVSAFCPEEHGEKGCDSFAMRRNGTKYDEKSGCTSIVCPNEGKIAFHNPATGSLVTATKQMHCVNGQWLTDLGEPVPPTLHVTCVDWRGSRSVCGNGGCTYSLEDQRHVRDFRIYESKTVWKLVTRLSNNNAIRAKMRYSEIGGCYELYCVTGNILGFNPKYSSWEPANQGHFTCSDKGWKRAYGVLIHDVTDYRFHIRVKCQ